MASLGGETPPLRPHLTLITSLKALFPNTITLGEGLQHRNLRWGHNSVSYTNQCSSFQTGLPKDSSHRPSVLHLFSTGFKPSSGSLEMAITLFPGKKWAPFGAVVQVTMTSSLRVEYLPASLAIADETRSRCKRRRHPYC